MTPGFAPGASSRRGSAARASACASAAAFARAQPLFLAASDAGAEIGEKKDGKDRKQGSGAGGQAEDKGEKGSGERGAGRDGAQRPGQKRQGKGEPDGGEQRGEGAMPARKVGHAQIHRTPKVEDDGVNVEILRPQTRRGVHSVPPQAVSRRANVGCRLLVPLQ